MPEPAYAIIIEPSTDLQRDQVQDLIKRTTDDWWHGMPDVWLVLGKNATEWRDLVGPIFPTVGSGKLLVLKLDTDASISRWAFRAVFPESTQQWLKEHLQD